MAALLESVLREKDPPSRIVQWIRNAQDDGGIVGLASSGLQLKEFVPCLLNFLREQTSQILSHGPPTPAKTPNSKSLRTTVERGGAPQSSSTPSRGASRVQLFSPVPCSSPEAEVETPGSQSLSGITFFSSPSFTTSPMHRSYPEKRSAQRNSLGEFLTTSPDLHHGQRRGRRRSGPSCNGGGRPPSRNQDNEHSKWESPLAGGGRRIRTETSEICTDSPLNLNNLDDFPPILTASVSAGRTKPSRRINPTPVSVERSFSKPKTCFTSTPVSQRSVAEENADSLVSVSDCVVPMGLQEEREMLRRERSKMAQQISVPVTTVLDPTTPTKLGCSRMRPSIPGDSACILADVNKVSYAQQLDILAQLYCVCISENLVPNVFLELFFVLQLLTSRSCGILDDENGKTDLYKDVLETPFFRSVHNCVYFAVKVLQTNFEVLAYLDKCTLRLLADNERIGCFAPSLRDQLLAAHEKSIAKVSLLVPSTIQSVSFQPATDNRSNFSSDKAFHTFKKQRDIFYELLREWEDYHKEPGWEFDRALGSRIRVMVSQLNAAGNHCHFARLFQKQLLQLCKSPHSSRSGDASDLDVLGMLGTDNLSRLKRLQERFIQSQSITGPCPPPSFQGHQEFFRDFLLSAGSFQLNQHLMDNLCQQILQLDSSDIIGIDNTKEEGEGDVEQQGEKQRFSSVLLTVRLLAKFLGFLTFLPYQTGERPAKDIQEAAVLVRSKTLPVVNICEVLLNAVKRRRLVLTVPWIVELLSMIDYISPFLSYYRRVFKLLLQIYRSNLLGRDRETCFLNKLLLVAVLGWLFQIPAVPEDLFFGSDFTDLVHSRDTAVHIQGLDSLPLVDQQLLYTCCPFLSEFRKLLAAFVAGSSSKNGGLIRKITPTAAEPFVPCISLSQQKLQIDLEQAFFHNQPPSLRRTVEFVAERVGSNCVKHIKATLVADTVQSGEAIMKEKLRDDGEHLKNKLLDAVCAQLCDGGKQALAFGKEFCILRAPEAVKVLLPEETSAAVLKTAQDIAIRMATEKACTWLAANIIALTKRELKSAYDRLVKAQRPTGDGEAETSREFSTLQMSKQEENGVDCPVGCEHKVSLPSKLIIALKEVLCVSLGPRKEDEHVDYRNLRDLLHNIRGTLICRKFILPVPEQMLARCTVMLACELVSGQLPLLCSELHADERTISQTPTRMLLRQLLNLWKENFHTLIPFQLLFSNKNVASILEASSTERGHFLFLMCELQKQQLLATEEVKQHLEFLQSFSWPVEFLVKIEEASRQIDQAVQEPLQKPILN
ncbi:codanin-1 [Erpetoichthys calabaricus]|uniref:Codanin 1 n=1 Tax=Erpetoichthys calabaricus TaxID=27687 RepID=A0A8C4XED8_ERPCA|nr:codanin-1 [Erpetoichthys calabaricus]